MRGLVCAGPQMCGRGCKETCLDLVIDSGPRCIVAAREHACIVMAYIVMAYEVTAYVVMACIVMASAAVRSCIVAGCEPMHAYVHARRRACLRRGAGTDLGSTSPL